MDCSSGKPGQQPVSAKKQGRAVSGQKQTNKSDQEVAGHDTARVQDFWSVCFTKENIFSSRCFGNTQDDYNGMIMTTMATIIFNYDDDDEDDDNNNDNDDDEI